MNIDKWLKNNAASLIGKRVAISGSTGGIGRELCRILAGLGAEIIMLDRSCERAEALSRELKAEFPDISCKYMRLDLEDIECVKEGTKALLSDTPDYLILNAGAYHIPRKI